MKWKKRVDVPKKRDLKDKTLREGRNSVRGEECSVLSSSEKPGFEKEKKNAMKMHLHEGRVRRRTPKNTKKKRQP